MPLVGPANVHRQDADTERRHAKRGFLDLAWKAEVLFNNSPAIFARCATAPAHAVERGRRQLRNEG